METKAIAEAFSGHRFAEAYDRLHDDVHWALPGHQPLRGKAAVVAACEDTARQLDELERVETVRFVSVADEMVAAVDVVARYVGRDGSVSVVSSADVYEFDAAGRIIMITSYAVELPT